MIQAQVDGKPRNVILADTAGQERFRELTSASYKSVDAVYVVYAVDDEATFRNCDKWLGEIDRYVQNKSVPRIVLANKADLASTRAVTADAGAAYAQSRGLPYLETSAKTDQNVYDALQLAFAPPKPAKSGCCVLL